MELPPYQPPVLWQRYLGIFPQISYPIVALLVNALATIVTSFLHIFKSQPAPLPASKPYRSMSFLSPSQQSVSFHPALAAAIGQNKAIILQKVLDWMDYNRATNKQDHLINGEWYTYDSARGWQQRHFYFIAIPTVKRLFQELEADGFIKRIQHRKAWSDYRQWVTIPAEARIRIDELCLQFTQAQEDQGGAQKNPPTESYAPRPAQKNPQTKRESSNKESSKSKPKEPQQPNTTKIKTQLDELTTVVVVESISQDPKAVTEELFIDGELEQQLPRQATRASAIAQAMHRENTNDTPISPIPRPPLSPSAVDLLRSDLIRFGVMPHTAQRLLNQHGAEDTRRVLAYAQGQRTLGPGFVIEELDHKRFGVLAISVLPTPSRLFEPHENLALLPPAIDDLAWNELIDMCAVSIPELKQAVCRAAGDHYEIAVDGAMTYLPLNHRKSEIQQHLEHLTGHPVSLYITVDTRLQADFVS